MAVYEKRRYLLMTTDPVHIGTGGYRLGRVDNSIVREPGTRIPKIPGTSLHGAIRSYAAQVYENLDAAGQTHHRVANPDKDPVCYTFGYIKTEREGESDERAVGYSGVVHIFDAPILFFPVYSMMGPVWVSTLSRLSTAGVSVTGVPDGWQDIRQGLFTFARTDALNLGWLMLGVGGQVSVSVPAAWQGQQWETIKERIVIVQESLFSQIVNSNLEVRTSVSIDPARGAAEDGALFTYEALPRATVLTLDVVLDDYRAGSDNRPDFPVTTTHQSNSPLPGNGWAGPLDVVEAGLDALAWLGVGGMGTRGFGRVQRVGEPQQSAYGEAV